LTTVIAQEYCYRSSRRDVVRSALKVLANNLKNRKRGASSTLSKRRFLTPSEEVIKECKGKKNGKLGP